MDINSDLPQDRPLRSEAETPHGDYDDPPIPRRRRALDDQIEKVTDETGEMVRGAFLLFLETLSLTMFVLMVDSMTIMIRRHRGRNQVRPRARLAMATFISRSWRKLNGLD